MPTVLPRPLNKRRIGGLGQDAVIAKMLSGMDALRQVPSLEDIPTGDTRATGHAAPVYSDSPREQQRYLAQRELKGLGRAIMASPDLVNSVINAGLGDINYWTGGLGGKRDVRLPSASQSLANLATEQTGAHIVPEARMPQAVRDKGGLREEAFAATPVDVGMGLGSAARGLEAAEPMAANLIRDESGVLRLPKQTGDIINPASELVNPPKIADSGMMRAYDGKWEMVPISWLRKLPGNTLREPTDALKASIQSEGVKTPLIINVGKNSRTAQLGEGNHRLAALEELGHTHAPVRVTVGSEWGKGKPNSNFDADIIPQPDRYFSSDAAPSEVFRSLQQPEAPAGLGAASEPVAPKGLAAPAEPKGIGIRAYHGSPHSFDQFDISKIGTGEGAQAYGHGLYFAENEPTAKYYRDQLAGRPEIKSLTVGSKRVGPYNQFDYSPRGNSTYENVHSSLIEDLLINEDQLTTDPARAQQVVIDSLKQKIQDYKTEWPEAVEPAKKLLNDISRPGAVSLKMGEQPGSMYEVNIKADPEHFLDYEKPLSEQSDNVKNALRASFDQRYGKGFFDKYAATGADFRDVHNNFDDLNEADVSAMLNKAGIPGIKYLDAGSRPDMGRIKELLAEAQKHEAAGRPEYAAEARKLAKDIENSGSRNYVVFDPKIIEIVKKYGIAAAVSAGLISEEMGRQMKAQGEL
jgi:ParB-like nuclease domain